MDGHADTQDATGEAGLAPRGAPTHAKQHGDPKRQR